MNPVIIFMPTQLSKTLFFFFSPDILLFHPVKCSQENQQFCQIKTTFQAVLFSKTQPTYPERCHADRARRWWCALPAGTAVDAPSITVSNRWFCCRIHGQPLPLKQKPGQGGGGGGAQAAEGGTSYQEILCYFCFFCGDKGG